MREITVKKEERWPLMAGILLLVQLALVVLKAFGYMPSKWIWVMMPLILSESVIAIVLIIAALKKQASH